MKINWGTGIFIFFTIFVIASLSQVFMSRKYMPELVKKDYYVDDLHLNEIVENRENVSELQGFSWTYEKDSIKFLLPHNSAVEGYIELINPMQQSLDNKLNFQLNASTQNISFSTSQLKKGKWNFHLNWKDDSQNYLFENTFIKI